MDFERVLSSILLLQALMFLLSESELSTCTLEFCDPRRILAISQKVAKSFFPYITLSFKFASQTSRFFHFLSDDCALRITSYILCYHAIIFNVQNTGKSLSDALLFAEYGENMLCTKIVLNIRNNFCTQHVLPRFELGIFMY